MTPAVGERRADRKTRAEAGRAERDRVPLAAHAELPARAGGHDALRILRGQDATRVPELVPIRYGRMVASPFSYYRGAAAVMAADLAAAPRTDETVQLCGDAHLANFGAFAAPDRRLVLDVNDFDETLPGPFDWDVKRLAASFFVAARGNGLSRKASRQLAATAVAAYREIMARAAAADPLTVWYYRVELAQLADTFRAAQKRRKKVKAKAARRNSLGALAKLTEVVDGQRRIVDRPPLVVRPAPEARDAAMARLTASFDEYLTSLDPDRRVLLDRYALIDVAFKVVGVGSVGNRCYVVLLQTGDGDPLFLQVKEAVPSVLEPYLGPSGAPSAAQRVVDGQRAIQAASDEFLGWTHVETATRPVDAYVRQLWDGKLSAPIEDADETFMHRYAGVCGAVIGRAHARTGDPAVIAGYLGDDDTFDRAVVAFSEAYADRTKLDHRELAEAVDDGAVHAIRDI